jgi:hypothetical protein
VDKTLSVALETSMLWHTYGLVRLSVIYRGRAVPVVWYVLEHGSARVAYEVSKALVDQANTLGPFACQGVVLAERGCTDTALLRHLKRLGWHCRLRIKANFWMYWPGPGGFQVRAISLDCGHARFGHGLWLPIKRWGPVHLAVARPLASAEYW